MKHIFLYIISNKNHKDIWHIGTMRQIPEYRVELLNLCYGVDVCALYECFIVDPEYFDSVGLEGFLQPYKNSKYASDAYMIELDALNEFISSHFREDAEDAEDEEYEDEDDEECEEDEGEDEEYDDEEYDDDDEFEDDEDDEDDPFASISPIALLCKFLGTLDPDQITGVLTELMDMIEEDPIAFQPKMPINETLKDAVEEEEYEELLSLDDDKKIDFVYEVGMKSLCAVIENKDLDSDEIIRELLLVEDCARYCSKKDYPLSYWLFWESRIRRVFLYEYANKNTQLFIEKLGLLNMVARHLYDDEKIEVLCLLARIYGLSNDIANAKLYWEYYWALIDEKDTRFLYINLRRYFAFCFHNSEKPCSLKKHVSYLPQVNETFIQDVIREVEDFYNIDQAQMSSMISDLLIEAFHNADESHMESLSQNKSKIITKIKMSEISLS